MAYVNCKQQLEINHFWNMSDARETANSLETANCSLTHISEKMYSQILLSEKKVKYISISCTRPHTATKNIISKKYTMTTKTILRCTPC